MTVIHVLEPFATGVTTAVISITQQLAEMKHLVIHGSRTGVDAKENIRKKFPFGVGFIEWRYVGREISLLGDIRALGELLKQLKPYSNSQTVIHLHSSKAGFLGRLACRLLNIRAVLYTPHCASFIRTDIGPLKRKIFRLLERIGGWLGGTVVGCGKSEADMYSQLGKPALWVSNGVTITAAVKDRDPHIISFTGLAGVQKNPALFNRIAAQFHDADVPFYWIGDGPLRNELNPRNIQVTGWVTKDQVDAYLYKTLIYLSTASWEGLPFGVLEAMNGSCALLVSNVPGNRDLVIPGENGYVFNDEQEAAALLRQMLADRSKTHDMGMKSRDLVKSWYSVEKMGEGYRKIYTDLVS
ncbi:MAG: glycosyltransferase [Treponema sp.]|jgi:glycosyltransferase involved in cell wall biosynthesis|nr:glycosyltransferase [Treponema sp.]